MDEQVLGVLPAAPPTTARVHAGNGRAWAIGRSVLVFGLGALAALAAARLAGAPGAAAWGWTLPVGLGLALVQLTRVPGRTISTLWALGLSTLALCCVMALAADRLPVRPYGDGAIFTQFVEAGRAVPRWLLGSAAAATLHVAVWDLPPLRATLPTTLQSTHAFLALLGCLTTVVGTWVLVRRWPAWHAVLLPLLTPVWVLFASGYVEYYPLIAGAFVGVLAWVFDRPLDQRSPVVLGAIGGLLPVIYVGFVPTAGLVLAAGMLAVPRRALHLLTTAAAVGGVAIATCWPEGLAHYFRALYGVMNFGEAFLPPQYAGQVAGPTSIMFATQAVFSVSRAREILYLLTWGAGWWVVPAVFVAAVLAWRQERRAGTLAWRDLRLWLGVALVAWHLYYLAWMVPRLGPLADIDLFFPTYLALAFVAGALLDRLPSRTMAQVAVTVALATLAVTGPWLVWHGLPPVP